MNNMRESFEKWADNYGICTITQERGGIQCYVCGETGTAWEAYQEAYNLQQAAIDLLMLEFCPQEMSREQFKNWESAQKRAPEEFQYE